ncbi:hypothetical protein KSS87_001391 [Heliosperma pusillum]|nr:hypothetical protein KSS87_001391 [Heliosperma pusillum]
MSSLVQIFLLLQLEMLFFIREGQHGKWS